MIWPTKKSHYQQLQDSLFVEKGVEVFMLRDDLLHPGISGNKWRKLKYNLLAIGLREPQAANGCLRASKKGNSSLRYSKETIPTIVTVGGSHSNHIAAVAEAGKVFGFKTIGLIRGYEAYRENPTLRTAANAGMEIRFFDKKEYANIELEYLKKLKNEIGDFEFVSMGGGNLLGMKGCVEINEDIPIQTTHIATACGTGSTMAGIVAGARADQTVLGFPAMKNGAFINADVKNYLSGFSSTVKSNFDVITDYHFGGFGKLNPELIEFINEFNHTHGFALDGLYNGKMMFGLYDLIRNDYFENGSIITAIHTGGVQGNLGLNEKYNCNLPT